MPSNIEVKARIRNIEELKKTASELSDSDGEVMMQEDTFFQCEKGRLKLRVFKNQDYPAELIFYERPDTLGPKSSDYHFTYITDHEGLKVTLGKALGIKGMVKKTRMLYLVGQTRVHVDDVEGLGHYMELEVVMRPDQSQDEGMKIANELMDKLNIKRDDLVVGAYMDLILNQNKGI
ncbi:uncharacterized protein LOC144448137 [Glandiceps talaboti]